MPGRRVGTAPKRSARTSAVPPHLRRSAKWEQLSGVAPLPRVVQKHPPPCRLFAAVRAGAPQFGAPRDPHALNGAGPLFAGGDAVTGRAACTGVVCAAAAGRGGVGVGCCFAGVVRAAAAAGAGDATGAAADAL